jgi:opacity protein-like surface antigen
MYALTLAGKATLPLNSLISLYSKIGLAYTRMSKIVRAEGVLDPGGPFHQQTSHSVGGITPMIGAGVQINLRDNLYAQLGWMMIPGKESPCSATNCDVLNRPMINTVTAGLGYRFDEVSAAEKTQRGSEKWYIEANAGYTLLSPIQPETDGLVPAPPCFISDTKTVTPFGIGTNTGYQFNRFIAAELGFNYFFVSRRTTSLTTIFIEDPPDPPVDFSARQQDQLTDIYALTLAGKATLPLNGLINLYSKLGLAYAGATFKHTQQLTVNGGESTQNSQETTSVNGISPVFGAGFELNLQHNFYVQFGWMMIPAKESSCSSGRCNSVKRPMINEVTGGLGYRFG